MYGLGCHESCICFINQGSANDRTVITRDMLHLVGNGYLDSVMIFFFLGGRKWAYSWFHFPRHLLLML